jgi:hypothetical protein
MEWSRKQPKKGDFILYIKEIIPDNIHHRWYGMCIADKLGKLNNHVRIFISTGECINVKNDEIIVII